LLIALLTSFDNDHKANKKLSVEKSSDIIMNKETNNKNNCTSTPSTATVSSSIRFLPATLDFGEQYV